MPLPRSSAHLYGRRMPTLTTALVVRNRYIKGLNVDIVYHQSFVFSYTSGSDLCTSSYYTNAVPIVRVQSFSQKNYAHRHAPD
jgi:hypothetical protein